MISSRQRPSLECIFEEDHDSQVSKDGIFWLQRKATTTNIHTLHMGSLSVRGRHGQVAVCTLGCSGR